MAEDDKIRGKIMRIQVDAEQILFATEFTCSQTTEMLEAFTKDSANFTDREANINDVTLSGAYLLTLEPATGKANYETLWDAWNTQTTIVCIWEDGIVGNPSWTGNFLVSTLDMEANADGYASGSYEFLINGIVTKSVQA